MFSSHVWKVGVESHENQREIIRGQDQGMEEREGEGETLGNDIGQIISLSCARTHEYGTANPAMMCNYYAPSKKVWKVLPLLGLY